MNDQVMSYILKKNFGVDGKVIDRPFLKEQICRQMNENIAEWAELRSRRGKTNGGGREKGTGGPNCPRC